jgi:hypothetical protein
VTASGSQEEVGGADEDKEVFDVADKWRLVAKATSC